MDTLLASFPKNLVFELGFAELANALKRISCQGEVLQLSVNCYSVTMRLDGENAAAQTKIPNRFPSNLAGETTCEFATRSDSIVSLVRAAQNDATVLFKTFLPDDDPRCAGRLYLQINSVQFEFRQLIDAHTKFTSLPLPTDGQSFSPTALAKCLKDALPFTPLSRAGVPPAISASGGELAATSVNMHRAIKDSGLDGVDAKLEVKAAKVLSRMLDHWDGEAQIAVHDDDYVLRCGDTIAQVPRGKRAAAKTTGLVAQTADSTVFTVDRENFGRGVFCISLQAAARDAVIELHHDQSAACLLLQIRCLDGFATYTCPLQNTDNPDAEQDQTTELLCCFAAADLRKMAAGLGVCRSLDLRCIDSGMLVSASGDELAPITFVAAKRRVSAQPSIANNTGPEA